MKFFRNEAALESKADYKNFLAKNPGIAEQLVDWNPSPLFPLYKFQPSKALLPPIAPKK